MLGLYLAMILAYGGFGPLVEVSLHGQSDSTSKAIFRTAQGLVVASAMLHFYFDGFIWKMREKATSDALGVGGGAANVAVNGHAFKWLLLLIPAGVFWYEKV